MGEKITPGSPLDRSGRKARLRLRCRGMAEVRDPKELFSVRFSTEDFYREPRIKKRGRIVN
jgi:hypothetical protein